ncbi:MAG TPA: hypothetical protein VLT45_25945 [Kofleriaceae bacterium]|nr:hypothetical protein [Kofleriaceae bacterium]
MSTTEQTGRLEMDSLTESQPRIEPAVLGLAPQGGDPTPLPVARAASGTKTKLKAVPPPIPGRTSAQTTPPPIPVIAAAAEKRDAAMQPDPDGWAMPASGPSYPSVYHHEPAMPDATVPTGAIEAAAEKPSPAWLAKIDSVMAQDGAPVDEKVVSAHEKAVTEAREAEELAKANAAANAALPKLPTARPSNAKLPPPPRSASGTRPPIPLKTAGAQPVVAPAKPVPPVAAAAAAMFTTKAKAPTADAPLVTAPLELVDLEPIDRSDAHAHDETPLPPPSPTDHVHDVLAKPAAKSAKRPATNPLVEAARKSFEAEHAGDFDIDWESNPDMTNAHTTNFELPQKSKLASRAALGLLVAAVFATVGYLATRSKTPAKHAAATASASQPAAAQPAAPTPAAAQPAPATPAVAQSQPVAAPVAAQKAPAQLQIPVSSMPPGAFVSLVDGDKADIVGQTPMTLTLDVSKPHDVALTMVGRETQLVHVPEGGLNTLAVTLPLKESAAAAAPAPATAPKASDEHVTAMVQPKQETPAPRHKAEPQHVAAPAPRRESAPAPKAISSAPAGSGVLMISSKPPCEIIVDGRSTHLQTPQRALPLAAGGHTIMLVNAQMHIKKQISVDIVAKKSTKVIQDFLRN